MDMDDIFRITRQLYKEQLVKLYGYSCSMSNKEMHASSLKYYHNALMTHHAPCTWGNELPWHWCKSALSKCFSSLYIVCIYKAISMHGILMSEDYVN